LGYELGYAYACGKDVVMVCSDERLGQFPFDIQHKQILNYQTKSKGDFEALEQSITNKIRALLKTSQTVKTLTETPVIEQEGLNSHEIALLLLTAENQFTSEDYMGVHTLKDEMSKAGYTDIATGVAIRLLQRKGMVETVMDSDWNNNNYLVCKVTTTGED
jgi:hypothetical protein